MVRAHRLPLSLASEHQLVNLKVEGKVIKRYDHQGSRVVTACGARPGRLGNVLTGGSR
jgi:hypothetical protein